MEHELLLAALGQWRHVYALEYPEGEDQGQGQGEGPVPHVPADLAALLSPADHSRVLQLSALCHRTARVLHVLDTWRDGESISGASPLSRALARALSAHVLAAVYRAFSDEVTGSERTSAGLLIALEQLTALSALCDLVLEIDRSARQHHVRVTRSVNILLTAV
jgi:hypothetical protein